MVESEIVIQRYNLDFFDKLARRADSYRVTVGPLGGAASGALGSRRWGRTLTVTALFVVDTLSVQVVRIARVAEIDTTTVLRCSG